MTTRDDGASNDGQAGAVSDPRAHEGQDDGVVDGPGGAGRTQDAAAHRRSGSRSRMLAFAGLTLGGLLGIVASSQPWWRASGDGADVPFTGADSTAGLSQALAIVGLAGTLLVLALRVRGKQVVAVLLALTGTGMAVTGLLRLRPTSSAVRTKLREISLADQFTLEPTGWTWVYAAAGLMMATGAVVMVLRAARWPQRADRFERTGSAAAEITVDTDSSVLWKAMDAGVDPTDAHGVQVDQEDAGKDEGRGGLPGQEVPESGGSEAAKSPGSGGSASP